MGQRPFPRWAGGSRPATEGGGRQLKDFVMVTVRLVGDKGLVISILARGSLSLAPWRGLGIPQILTREFPKHQRWKKGFFPQC